MKRIFYLLLLLILYKTGYSQQKVFKTSAYGYQAGYFYRNCNSFFIGGNYLFGGEVDSKRNKHIGLYTYGPSINFSLSSENNPVFGQNIGFSGSVCNHNLIGLFGLLKLEHFKNYDFRFSPEIGISLWEIIRLTYSHSIPLFQETIGDIGNDSYGITIVINRIPFDVLFRPAN